MSMHVRLPIALGLLVTGAAFAQAKVTASVEQKTVQVGAPFLITVEASGGSVEEPVLPEVPGLQIERTPRQRADSMQFSFPGGASKSIVRGYLAVALRAGTIEIPPITVVVDGTPHKTRPIVLTVVEGPAPQAAPQEPGPGQQSAPPMEEDSGGGTELTWDDLVLVTSETDKTEAYQGEPILLTLGMWEIVHPSVSVSVRGSDVVYPTTEGFYSMPQQPEKTGAEIRMRNGHRYRMTRLCQTLYPTAVGALVVGPWQVVAHASAWTGFGRDGRSYHLSTEPIRIVVKPLPSPPRDFSGAVGRFTAAGYLSPSQVSQGVPAELVVRIAGRGNPNTIGAPQRPEISGADISEPRSTIESGKEPSGLEIIKTFSYSVRPHVAGDLTLPQVTFCYFDPEAGAYQRESVGPFTLRVLPAAEQGTRLVVDTSRMPEEKPVDVIGQDILDIEASPGPLRRTESDPMVMYGVVFGPPVVYGGLAVMMARKRRLGGDQGLARAYRARSKGRKRLRAVMHAKEPAEELYRAVTEYVADKFGLPSAGVTSADVERLFAEKGLEDAAGKNLAKIVKACERARYASSGLTRDELRALTEGALMAMDRLETVLKREGRL